MLLPGSIFTAQNRAANLGELPTLMVLELAPRKQKEMEQLFEYLKACSNCLCHHLHPAHVIQIAG